MSVFCLDVGTTSIKAALINRAGLVLSHGSYSIDNEKELSSQWKEGFFSLLVQCLKQENPQTLRAICISGNGPSLVRLSPSNQVVDYSLWNEELSATQKQLAILQQSKSLFLSHIFALQNRKPFTFGETLLGIPEFLTFLLTEKKATILPNKSFQPAYWDSTLLDSLGLEKSLLPSFVKPGTYAGNADFSSFKKFFNTEFFQTISSKKISVYFGAPDFISALIGTNTLFNGAVCDRAGSSEGINLCLNFLPEHIPNTLRLLPSIIPNHWNLSYLIPQSGILLQKSTSDIQIETALKKEIQRGISELRKFFTIDKMTISGGQAKNTSWLQKKAQALQVNIELPECIDSELLGNAILVYSTIEKIELQECASQMLKTKRVVTYK